ncbi:MAG: ATP-dependent DNA helicase, partial [Myxococcaceae bacterium]
MGEPRRVEALLSVDSVLGPGGAISAALERYEHRPEQLRVAHEVERAFDRRELLLAEAGTGTGKTLAYLLPAILSGRKTVVSTATKTLQEQVFFKDVPLLRDRVGLQFNAALLKGRSNYLCLQRFEQFGNAPEFASKEEAALWPMLKSWALKTDTGDRAELELPDNFSAWHELSTTSETCLGQKCPLYEPCFVTRARRTAEDADVLVVNHHLFFADLALKGRGTRASEGVIPRYEAVIFDEAHALEDVAAEYFGASVSNFRFEDLVRDCLKALETTSERGGMLSAIALQLRGRAELFFKSAAQRLRLGYSSSEATASLTAESLAGLGAQADELVHTLQAISAFASGAEEPEVLAVGRRATEVANDFDFIRTADSLDHVFWAEARGRGLFLRAAPIEIAKELRGRLYSAVDTVIFTSATLTADGRFDFFAKRMGLRGEPDEDTSAVREVRVDSPFDFPKQAALY